MANPEIAAIRAFLAQGPQDRTLEELREAYAGLGALFPTPEDVERTTTTVAGVAAEWTRAPGARPERVILYLHGGGYVIGSIASHRHLAAELGRASGASTLAIDYRLAPEVPFPGAVDDALAAYKHLLAEGFDPGSIAIAGDSAGGGLTVATLLAAKDAGLPQPACGFCISPWVDLEGLGGTMTSKADEDPMIQKSALLAWGALYLGPAAPTTPYAAPIYGDLSGLAPLLIHVGAAEALLDDSIRLAAVTGAAGTSVRLDIAPEMIHVWHFFFPMLGEGRAAIASAGAFIAQHFKPKA